MVFIKKVVNPGDLGDADHVGGPSWDLLDDFNDNIDIGGTARRNTLTYFRSGKFQLRNVADSQSLTFNLPTLTTAGIGVNYPNLTANDEPLFKTFAATLSNKTIDQITNVIKLQTPYKYVVFIDAADSNKVKCIDVEGGGIVSNNASALTTLQYAVDNAAGAPILAKLGDYSLSGPLNCVDKYVWIEGESTGNAYTRFYKAGAGNIINCDNTASLYQSVHLKNLVIDGVDKLGVGLRTDQIKHCFNLIENVHIINCLTGWHFTNGWYNNIWHIFIENCATGLWIENNSQAGTMQDGGNTLYFYGGKIQNCTTYNVNVDVLNEQMTFYGTIFENDETHDNTYTINIDSEAELVCFHDCSFENFNASAIVIHDAGKNTRIQNCRFQNNDAGEDYTAYEAVGARSSLLEGNQFGASSTGTVNITIDSSSQNLSLIGNMRRRWITPLAVTLTDNGVNTTRIGNPFCDDKHVYPVQFNKELDIVGMTAPSSPPSGTLSLYVDTADSHLKHKNSSGTVVDITSAVTSGGEANTASNLGAGQGVFKSKVGVDLQFRSLTATSTKISLANNTNDIGIDVTEANLTLSNLGGSLAIGQVPNNLITYAKIQDVTVTSRIMGRITAGGGDMEELTGTQATTLLDVFTTALKGLAPASGGGTTNFLRADGTWAAPAGGGDVTQTGTQTLTNKTIDFALNTIEPRDFLRVFKSGSTYYAIKQDGTVLSSSSTAETVIAAAFAAGPGIGIHFADTTYALSAGFTGFTIKSHTRAIFEGGSLITVPQGYTGDLFLFDDPNGSYCFFSGGQFDEAGTPTKLWKGIHLKSDSSTGIKHNTFHDMQIDDAGWMVYMELATSASAFVNSNHFYDIYGYYPIVGFEWVNSSGGGNFSHNLYNGIDVQADANTTHGFKNVMASVGGAEFYNPSVQDQTNTQTQMLIHSSAADVSIFGGSLMQAGSAGIFTDNGTNTVCVNRGEGIYLNSKIRLNGITAPSSPAAGSLRLYVDTADTHLKHKNSSGTVVDLTAAASGGGEANTASNLGAGQGIFKSKVGVDLQFRSITATSTKISLANNTNDIGLDVSESNLTLSNIGGSLAIGQVPNDLITYAKIQNVSATDRLLGRDTAAAGDIEELTLDTTLEFTGGPGIRRAALTGDITASAGSNTTAIASAVIVDSDINASGITTRSKLPSAIAYEDEANTYTLTQSIAAKLDAQKDFYLSGQISPTQLTADQNDYNPANLGTSSVLMLTSDKVRKITGLAGGTAGRVLMIHNMGTEEILFSNQNTGSTTANRFDFGESRLLLPSENIIVYYDTTNSRWRNSSSNVKSPSQERLRPSICSDCGGTGTASMAPYSLAAISSGTVSTVNSEAEHPGIVKATSSTTANSGVNTNINNNSILLAGGETFECILRFSGFTNNTVRIGFGDTTTNADNVDGVYFEMAASSTVSGKTANNSTRSTAASTFTASTATWYHFKINVISSSLVEFYIFSDAGALLYSDTLTTNIPTASGRVCGPHVIGTNSTTTATDIYELDHIGCFPGALDPLARGMR